MELKNDVKRSIMAAAAEIFAENGYRHGTIREIAKKAGVNIAAVNYYFGNKELLYQQVMNSWTEDVFSKYPFLAPEDYSLKPEERMRRFIDSILGKLFDEESMPWFGKLFVRTVIDENQEQSQELVRQIYRPSVDVLVEILKELAPERTEEELFFMASNIIGQCVFYYSNRSMIRMVFSEEQEKLTNIKWLGEHITRFSLAAVTAYGER